MREEIWILPRHFPDFTSRDSKMAKDATPKPMPTTGMPDRVSLPPPAFDQKAGVKTQGDMNINPGRK